MLVWFVNYKRWETLVRVPYRLLVLLIPREPGKQAEQ